MLCPRNNYRHERRCYRHVKSLSQRFFSQQLLYPRKNYRNVRRGGLTDTLKLITTSCAHKKSCSPVLIDTYVDPEKTNKEMIRGAGPGFG